MTRTAQFRKATEPDWAAVAVACGFFDQSNLICDFGELSGLSPWLT